MRLNRLIDGAEDAFFGTMKIRRRENPTHSLMFSLLRGKGGGRTFSIPTGPCLSYVILT